MSSVEYLGLAISPNAVDLDNTAGKDIVVSGKDSIVVILSKPTFSLKKDVEFNYKNNGKNGVYIEDVVAKIWGGESLNSRKFFVDQCLKNFSTSFPAARRSCKSA